MTIARTVLVVEDDQPIAELLRDYLVAAGYEVVTAGDAEAARAAMRAGPVDCLLLDVMLPGESGFELCRRVRTASAVPILFLSARDGDVDKLRGLGLGADDYIAKSATPAEVVARVGAVLRRAAGAGAPAPAVLDFGRLALDLRAHEARVAGQPVALSAREFSLLRLLAEHPRQIFTRDQLYERFWGGYGDRHALTVCIGRLREKIEADPATPRLIATVWGVGYRFEGIPR